MKGGGTLRCMMQKQVVAEERIYGDIVVNRVCFSHVQSITFFLTIVKHCCHRHHQVQNQYLKNLDHRCLEESQKTDVTYDFFFYYNLTTTVSKVRP